MTLIPGAEISCVTPAPDPGEPPISLHLLAYLFDPAEPEFARARADLRESRVGRARRMVDQLVADGHPVNWAGVTAEAAGTVGRPHIARALLRAGLVGSMDEAFTRDWIGTGGRYWAGKLELDVGEGIRLVRRAGGVAVFAHPYAWERGRTVGPDVIRAMAAAGLRGLEVDHPDHSPEARVRLRELAAELDLVVTGSSDFHEPSQGRTVGAETTDPEALAALVAAATGAQPVQGR
jgi:predicted metal-dependent phosphoesterase TrpH